MSRSLVGKPVVRKLFSSSQVGVVVSAGRMSKAVKVRIAGQQWNNKFRKHFPLETTYLVSDPNSSLVEGDVVRIASGWRTSKNIRHVVTDIVAPFGTPVEQRPPILSEEARMAQRVRDRLMKDVRAAAQGRQTSLQRLAEARRQKLEIPSLEEAMRNVRLAEKEEGAGKAEKHAGQTGQAETNKARRMAAGKETRAEKDAKEEAKSAATQTI